VMIGTKGGKLNYQTYAPTNLNLPLTICPSTPSNGVVWGINNPYTTPFIIDLGGTFTVAVCPFITAAPTVADTYTDTLTMTVNL